MLVRMPVLLVLVLVLYGDGVISDDAGVVYVSVSIVDVDDDCGVDVVVFVCVDTLILVCWSLFAALFMHCWCCLFCC